MKFKRDPNPNLTQHPPPPTHTPLPIQTLLKA